MANKKRLIDANELIATLEKIAKEDETLYFHLDEITQEIFDAPAVEVVQSDCYWATEQAHKNGYAKGVKEFAERLKEKFTLQWCGSKYGIIHSWIDNLVKEMVGADNG